MNTLFITRTGRIMLDENGEPKDSFVSRNAVSDVYFLTEDTHIVYQRNSDEEEHAIHIDGKAGDIVVTFYERKFPHKAVVISNAEWKENLETYARLEQEEKEKWAAEKSNNGSGPVEVECACADLAC